MEQMASHQTGINQGLEQGHQATHQSWSQQLSRETPPLTAVIRIVCQFVTDLQTPETRSSEQLATGHGLCSDLFRESKEMT